MLNRRAYVAPLFFLIISLLATTSVVATTTPVRYDDGARYAFVSDLESNQLAVIDTFEGKFLEHITLDVVPADIVVNDVIDTLVYSDFKQPVLYTYDLVTRKGYSIELPFVPETLVFHPEGVEVAIAGENKLITIDPLARKTLAQLDDIKGPVNINYSSDGYSMFITERGTGKVTVRREHAQSINNLQFGDGQTTSDLSLSPDTRIALVSLEKDNSLWIWDIYARSKVTEIKLDSLPWRPYVSATGKHIVMTTTEGNAYVIDAWTNQLVRQLEVGDKPTLIRTGWLETKGIVASEGELNLFELTGDAPAKTFPVAGRVNNMVVVSDSKTLYATQSESTDLLLVDIRSENIRSKIPTGLKRPSQIAMGVTNTACH